ncbi:MAG: hypothetical protein PHX78_04975 [bacterium]|nr:hypothetical protein [bacterium]
MKKILVILGLILIGAAGLFISSCGSGIEKFGEEIGANTAKTAIGTILLNPGDYVNKEVIIEGKIASECPTGGWINVSDASGGGTIYVEMHGTPITIPQRVGKNVEVKGMVYQTESEPKETKILAKGLIIK